MPDDNKIFSRFTPTVKYFLAKKDNSISNYFTDENIEESWLEHDNWNGGQEFYNIILNIPADLFDELESQNKVAPTEELIQKIYQNAMRGHDGPDHIANVYLRPVVQTEWKLQEINDDSLWEPNFFRLFISHVSNNKSSAANLKICLAFYGIDGFVAHDDIEPTKEWELEIGKALFTMDALCAIISKGFIGSKWCDQEVGIALGQHKPVFTIEHGGVPHGFIARFQALKNKDGNAVSVAKDLWDIIRTNEDSKAIYYNKLISLIINATNIDNALQYLDVLKDCHNIEKGFIDKLYSNFNSSDVLNSEAAINKANEIFERFNLAPLRLITKQSTILPDEDLPF